MFAAAPFLGLLLLASDGGASAVLDREGAEEVERADRFDFHWASQVLELAWHSSKQIALARFKGLRAAAKGWNDDALWIRRGDVDTYLVYDSKGLQRFEMHYLNPANVLASIRARWGEPGIEPGVDLVHYAWHRPGAVVTVEEHVESAGMSQGSLAATRRVVFEPPVPPTLELLGNPPASAGTPSSAAQPTAQDAGPSLPIWEPATAAERDVASSVLARVVADEGGRPFCVFHRVLVVETEDGGELGLLSQTVRGTPEVMSESFREFALRASGIGDQAQFSLRSCRGRSDAAALTFRTIDVEGGAATVVVEWRPKSASPRVEGSDIRYSLRRAGPKWEVVGRKYLVDY